MAPKCTSITNSPLKKYLRGDELAQVIDAESKFDDLYEWQSLLWEKKKEVRKFLRTVSRMLDKVEPAQVVRKRILKNATRRMQAERKAKK